MIVQKSILVQNTCRLTPVNELLAQRRTWNYFFSLINSWKAILYSTFLSATVFFSCINLVMSMFNFILQILHNISGSFWKHFLLIESSLQPQDHDENVRLKHSNSFQVLDLYISYRSFSIVLIRKRLRSISTPDIVRFYRFKSIRTMLRFSSLAPYKSRQVMVYSNCHLGRMQTHRRDDSLGMYMRDYLEYVNQGEKTQPKCVWYYSIGSGLRQNKIQKTS